METLIISHQEVSKLLPMAECVSVMKETFMTLGRGGALQPLRQAVWLPDKKGVLALMPSYLPNPSATGAKIITVFPGNLNTPYESHQGAVLVFECETGRLLAIVDASSVTAIRTAAVSAVATKALAKKDASDLTIFGSGTQASMHLEAMSTVRPIKRVRVWSRNPEHAEEFARRESSRGRSVEAFRSAQDAIAGCDIVCTTTASTSPILKGKWLEPGVHINAIGASVSPFRELDSEAVVRSTLFVDRRESTLNESEDFLVPKKEGLIGDDHIKGELGEVLLGRVKGRVSDDEITLFKSVGLAVEDLASAYHVYRKAETARVGTRVRFSAER
ncbi:MAG: ornithine cyclodeaminase family protein [Candidatus Bathyarchaeia archaeon]